MFQGVVKGINKDHVELETPDQHRTWIELKRITTPFNIGDVLVGDLQTGEFQVDRAATEERLKNLKLMSDQYFE